MPQVSVQAESGPGFALPYPQWNANIIDGGISHALRALDNASLLLHRPLPTWHCLQNWLVPYEC